VLSSFTGYNYVKDQYFNIQKTPLLEELYHGISESYFNNDLVLHYSMVSHGIPYMALIYLNDIQKKNTPPSF
jgi:hypothetical protein